MVLLTLGLCIFLDLDLGQKATIRLLLGITLRLGLDQLVTGAVRGIAIIFGLLPGNQIGEKTIKVNVYTIFFPPKNNPHLKKP